MDNIVFADYSSTYAKGIRGVYRGVDIFRSDIIKAVMLWNDNFHPLTCGDCEEVLLPSVQHGVVVLVCPNCEYQQSNIPTEVFSNYYERSTK